MNYFNYYEHFKTSKFVPCYFQEKKEKKETKLFPVYTEICKKCNLCVLCYNDPQTLPSFGILPSKFIIDTL